MKYRNKWFYKLCLVITGIFCLSAAQLFAQSSTTQGTDFWLAFGQHRGQTTSLESTFELQLKFAAGSEGATVTLTFNEPASGVTSVQTVIVNPNSIATKLLTTAERNSVYSYNTTTPTPAAATNPVKSGRSLHITSTKPISIYALNQHNTQAGLYSTSDASNILPTNALGNDYYHLGYKSNGVTTEYNAVLIVATSDGTTTILKNGAAFTSLTKGQVYYFPNIMDGDHITSNQPIAYFASHQGAFIPDKEHYNGDILFQQLAAVNSWGTHFLVPNTFQNQMRIKVIAAEAATTVSYQTSNSSTPTNQTLARGAIWEFSVTGGANCWITSNKPIGVTSYLLSYTSPFSSPTTGSPSEVWIPPVEQCVKSTIVAPFQPQGSNPITHYLLIIAPTANTGNTTVKKGTTTVTSGISWETSKGNYSIGRLKMDADAIYTIENNYGAIALIYGVGNAASYYYVGGSAVYDLTTGFLVNNELYLDVNGKVFCDNQFNFKTLSDYASMLGPFQNYLNWYINDVQVPGKTNTLEWDTTLVNGSYTVKLEVGELAGDKKSASTTFTVEIPTVSVSALGIAINGTLTLSPNTGGTWVSNNPTVATVTPSGTVTGVSEGMADFTFTSTNGCSVTTDKITVATEYPPKDPYDFYVNDIISATVNGMTFCNDEVHFRTVKDYTNEATKPTFQWFIDSTTEHPDGTNQWDWTTTLAPGPHTVKLVVGGNTANAVSTTFTIEMLTVSINGVPIIEREQTLTLNANTYGIWVSDNPTVATVTTGGKVTGVSEGTATFTFTSIKGCTATTDAVTVIKKKYFLPVNRIKFHE